MIIYSESNEYGGHESATISLVNMFLDEKRVNVKYYINKSNSLFLEAIKIDNKNVELNSSTNKYPLYNLLSPSYYLKVFRLFNKTDETILFASGNMDFNLVPILIANLLNKNAILYIPFLPYYKKLSKNFLIGGLRDKFHNIFFRLISRIILIKESDIKLIKLRSSNIKTLLIENVIAETDLKWKKNNQNRKIFKIVVPGRLVISQKNQLQALDILKDLHSLGLNVSMTFMGKGTDLNLIKQKSNELGLNNSVNFTGHVFNMIETILSDFDLVLFTTKYEGIPLTLLELINSGIPIVGSNIDVHKIYLRNSDIFKSNNEAVEIISSYLLNDKSFILKKTYDHNAITKRNTINIKTYLEDASSFR